jgi:Trypsin
LTASHCVNGKDLPPTWTLSTIRVGEWDLTTERDCDSKYEGENICNNGAQDIPIEERIPHPQYDPNANNQHHDIALIRLAQPIEYSEYVKPICLPSDPATGNLDFTAKTLSVAGWGNF